MATHGLTPVLESLWIRADRAWYQQNMACLIPTPFLAKKFCHGISDGERDWFWQICWVTKTFAFGPAGETAAPASGGRRPPTGPFGAGGASGGSSSTGHRYVLSVAMTIRNVVNRDNPGPIIGNVTSPLFGRANQPYGAGSLGGTGFSESANNRRLELQIRFRF